LEKKERGTKSASHLEDGVQKRPREAADRKEKARDAGFSRTNISG